MLLLHNRLNGEIKHPSIDLSRTINASMLSIGSVCLFYKYRKYCLQADKMPSYIHVQNYTLQCILTSQIKRNLLLVLERARYILWYRVWSEPFARELTKYIMHFLAMCQCEKQVHVLSFKPVPTSWYFSVHSPYWSTLLVCLMLMINLNFFLQKQY